VIDYGHDGGSGWEENIPGLLVLSAVAGQMPAGEETLHGFAKWYGNARRGKPHGFA
jgi:hypothetical protein